VSECRERRYRHRIRREGLVGFEVALQETDLLILAESDLSALAGEVVSRVRGSVEGYIAQHPEFLHALTPLPYDRLAPLVVREMLAAAQRSGTGPMASVAGAVADRVGQALLRESSEVVVENGGDCFIKVDTPLQIGIFAGRSVFSERLALCIQPELTPLGVCTSSGALGHSLSLGCADAATVLASSAALADAAATVVCNQVQKPEDINKAIAFARSIEGVLGLVVIADDHIGAWGEVELAAWT
jgi:hypothetical protein